MFKTQVMQCVAAQWGEISAVLHSVQFNQADALQLPSSAIKYSAALKSAKKAGVLQLLSILDLMMLS